MGEKNLNKDFSNTRRGGVTILREFFSKSYIFLNDGFPYYHPPTHNHHLCWSTRWGGSILGRLVCTCREEPKGDLRDDDNGLWLWWYWWGFWLIFCPLQNFENLKMETFLWLYGFLCLLFLRRLSFNSWPACFFNRITNVNQGLEDGSHTRSSSISVQCENGEVPGTNATTAIITTAPHIITKAILLTMTMTKARKKLTWVKKPPWLEAGAGAQWEELAYRGTCGAL